MKEIDTLKQVSSLIGEKFEQYLIIVKGEKDIFWKSSDRTWAIGASHRYITSADEADRYDERKQIEINEDER